MISLYSDRDIKDGFVCLSEPFCDIEEIADGFSSYDKTIRYETVTRDMVRIRLNETDRDILSLLGRCPLLPTSCIVDVVGESAYERVKVLFDNGYLSRFSATNPSGFVKSVFYLSDNTYSFVKIKGEDTFLRGAIDQMSNVSVLETAALSKWCAYAMLYQPRGDVKLLAFKERTMENPYFEAVMEKNIAFSRGKGKIPCRFHVVCCPKDDKVMAFLGALYHFDGVVRREEELGKARGLRSYVVIVCQSISRMEHFAVELENMIYTKTLDALSAEHFLYSLETDGMIELGAFKFMHAISFPELTIRHEQVAFR